MAKIENHAAVGLLLAYDAADLASILTVNSCQALRLTTILLVAELTRPGCTLCAGLLSTPIHPVVVVRLSSPTGASLRACFFCSAALFG
jgi:hypothetical protein